MTPLNLLLLGFVGLILYFYVQGLRVRELAIAETHRYCQQHHLQLLDQSVHLKKVRLGKATEPCMHRQYNFEFSTTGDERYQGYIIMKGFIAERIWIPAHRIPDGSLTPPDKPEIP